MFKKSGQVTPVNGFNGGRNEHYPNNKAVDPVTGKPHTRQSVQFPECINT